MWSEYKKVIYQAWNCKEQKQLHAEEVREKRTGEKPRILSACLDWCYGC